MRTDGTTSRRRSARLRRSPAIGAAVVLVLALSPEAGAAQGAVDGPEEQPHVHTAHDHAAEDHVIHDEATENRLEASTRRQTRAGARAADAAVAASPAEAGEWSPVVDWPVVGVHVALLSNGKVLAYDSVGDQATENYPVHNHTRATVFDPATGTHTAANVGTGYNIFCSGLSHLADGRVFLAGGNKNSALDGIVQTHTFNSDGNTWALGPNMAVERWYPSVTPLNNGDQLITSGRPNLVEVYQTNGTIKPLTTANQTLPLYPWIDVAPDGRAVHTGPDQTMRKLNTSGTGSWSSHGQRDAVNRDYGGHALYDVGKVLVAGGGPSTRTAEVINISASSPTVSATASMETGRRQHNLTVLADGTVLANGGLSSGAGLVDLNAGAYTAERWDPATGQWTTLAAESVTRQYHSSSLLLPDGRVLSSGGGICGTCDDVGYLAKNAQIFSPPYLFDAAGQPAQRPTITTAPGSVDHAAGFTVATPDAADISKAALVRLGAVTHSNNMEQRYVPVSFTAGSGSLQVTAPANANIAPPGYYMLFLVNSAGVPSMAKMVRLTTPPPPPDAPPTVQITAPADGTTFPFWPTITIKANASDDNGVTKVEFFRAGTTRLGTDTTSPYSYTWRMAPSGTHYLTAKATDTAGKVTTSAQVRIVVRRLFG